MDLLEISRDKVVLTVNNRHRGLIDPSLTRMAAVHWFDEQHIVFVDAAVKRRELDESKNEVRLQQVSTNVVLDLTPDLPAGSIDRDMKMPQILKVVADSFGELVTCHPDEKPSRLYSGAWDGKTLSFKSSGGSAVAVCGSFSPGQKTCNLVWVFNLERYRSWFIGE